MPFLTEDIPTYGWPIQVAPGVRRVVARNPSVMTYHGTNTYLIDGPLGVLVLDPGPDNGEQVGAILAACAGGVAKILLSHRHGDHADAVPALSAATGAPVYAFGSDPIAEGAAPDCALRHDDVIDGLRVLHTPGHSLDHICFAREVDELLFSGDHVMSWSSSIVSPPGGSMSDYFTSLELILERQDALLLPGHGPPMPDPKDYIRGLLEHRLAREQAIWLALQDGPQTASRLADSLYHKATRACGKRPSRRSSLIC
jgi:glyoxylase-like metal-dependent hydrolase (beta-lactamase superfamily II)